MSTPQIQDTIVAISTAPGIGAIGVIRISGKQSFAAVSQIFKGKNIQQIPSHRIVYGHIQGADGQVLDEVVLSLFRAPNSYTKEDTVEIACHGSTYILEQVVKLLINKGCRYALPGEFTQRAFLNGRFDLAQAEAVADLIEADNHAAHLSAMHQLRGGLSNEIQSLREKLIHFAALVELELDFSEEDVEFADRTELRNLVKAVIRDIEPLIQSFNYGNAVKKGVMTVIAGRPNAGKSTLLNALLKEERAIVSEIAGTTRDTIEELYKIENITFRLIDTAGIREATDALEQIGVQKTLQKVQQATVLIYVYDVSAVGDEAVIEDLKTLERDGMQIIVVANKMDLILHPHEEKKQRKWPYTTVEISSKSGHNLESLQGALLQTVKSNNLSDTYLITNARHYQALVKTKEALLEVLRNMDKNLSNELLAFHIKDALHSLGSITGQIDVDKDILGTIFGKFCIGK